MGCGSSNAAADGSVPAAAPAGTAGGSGASSSAPAPSPSAPIEDKSQAAPAQEPAVVEEAQVVNDDPNGPPSAEEIAAATLAIGGPARAAAAYTRSQNGEVEGSGSGATGSDGLKPQVIFVLGGPGAGKGTQCGRIVSSYGWVHLSAGDLLRDERARGGDAAALIEECIVEGKIVPVETTIALLKAAMDSSISAGKSQFLVDGFPRNAANLDGWHSSVLGVDGPEQVNMLFVLFFDCSADTMKARVLARGAGGSGRADDNETALEKRFATYQDESKPIIDAYESTGRAVKVDANDDEDTVWTKVQEIFKAIDRNTKPMEKTVIE